MIVIAVLCFAALLVIVLLLARILTLARQAERLKRQLALAEARITEIEAVVDSLKTERDQAKAAVAAALAPPSCSDLPRKTPGGLLSDEQKAILRRRLGERLPAMQYKMAVAASDDPAARRMGLQLMQFFEDEGLSLIAQRNPRAPYASGESGIRGVEMLVKYKRSSVPEFAEQLRDALAAAGVTAELRHDPDLNLEEIQLVTLPAR